MKQILNVQQILYTVGVVVYTNSSSCMSFPFSFLPLCNESEKRGQSVHEKWKLPSVKHPKKIWI